jgi:DNA-binding response OmpR family regulator
MSKKILLVDDDPVARIFLTETLTAKGYSVTTFDSPISAMPYAEVETFDVAILDTYMPGLSGVEFFAELRRLAHLQRIKVIMMSADKDCFNLLEEAGLIPDKVLLKPIKFGNLVAAIEEN